MNRFAIEHLPRAAATYHVMPLQYSQAQTWLRAGELTSLIRTTELIGAIDAAFGCSLQQSDSSMSLSSGDEALLISISFSVLLAWAEGDIVPVEDDWRCLLLQVDQPHRATSPLAFSITEQITSEPSSIG